MIQKIKQILIIADDLSGAADCTAGAMRAGLDVQVTLSHALADSAFADSPQVWSIDADTRRLPASEAASINAEILQRFGKSGQLLYKKIDSTLRGNFAAELTPLLALAGMAVVAPAFPDAGRCTRNGRQYVNGVALEETEVWRHEGMSGIADLPKMLSGQGVRTAALSLVQVRAGQAMLSKTLRDCMLQGVQAVVCDAETNDDLERIAMASVDLSDSVFWVGSAGLANYLPDAAGLVGSDKPSEKLQVKGPILTVVGSLSTVSREQAKALINARAMGRVVIPTDVLSSAGLHGDWNLYQSRLRSAIQSGKDILVAISDVGEPDLQQGLALCQGLAALISPFSSCLGGMISMGGETTHALLSAFESTGLRMLREVEPGVPLSVTLGSRSFPIITKAGAFGTLETLVYCYDTLHQMRLESAHDANTQKNNVRVLLN